MTIVRQQQQKSTSWSTTTTTLMILLLRIFFIAINDNSSSSKTSSTSSTQCGKWNVLSVIPVVVGGWVDPDTEDIFFATKPLTPSDKRNYKLVFSDEFNKDGRTFQDGNDPRWTALDKNDYTNEALHFYSSSNAITTNGVLNITTELKTNSYLAFNEKMKKKYPSKKFIQSSMLQGWNKFCFTGGIVEFRAKLPGHANTPGLWPAFWLLGNLARATYVGSSDYMWPFSYNKCNPKTRVSQEINACQGANHYSMESYRGRGAPEIDILEAMGGENGPLPNTNIQRPYISTSLQVAPGVDAHRPVLGDVPKRGHWYTNLEYGNKTKSELNNFFYGVTLFHEPKSYTYQSDAISANTNLTQSNYKRFHVYRAEWEPPNNNSSGGYIKWFIDNEFVFGVHGDSLSITQTEIPSEPMYMIINTAVATSWGFPLPCPSGCDCDCFECGNSDCMCGFPDGFCSNFPAQFEVDYTRIWMAVNESKHRIGCSTKERPTDLFIKGHRKRYMSEGDRMPLKHVVNGGARCNKNHDCGGPGYGMCTNSGRCVCNNCHTGPNCLAHFGSNDHRYTAHITHLDLYGMIIPTNLIIAFNILSALFIIVLVVAVRNKTRSTYGHPVGVQTSTNGSHRQTRQYTASTSSYQNASADYAIPTKLKMVNYMVIDKRLIDT